MPDTSHILVFADWYPTGDPKPAGILSAQQAKGRKAFSFEYYPEWLASKKQILIDPDISWYTGPQYPKGKDIFGVFSDAMPDTWGRKLMIRRAALLANEKGKSAANLYDIDFLLGVYDQSRMGALRFKLQADGPFLDNNADFPTPHWSHIRELQHAAAIIESGSEGKEAKKYLSMLIAPGSSLGGARPKANILDDKGDLWIAKFPAAADTMDKAAWEYLTYRLALLAGINMSPSRIEKISGRHHTFFTKRFDRNNGRRIHFASAMTMTGNNEDTVKDNPPGYLGIAEFIQYSGADNMRDLQQLWKRMVFNIAVSNTDDHLRNHGFIMADEQWHLSPAYDINPSIDKSGLSLNIDESENRLSLELAKSVGEYFQLDNKGMDSIIGEVIKARNQWDTLADEIGISRPEKEDLSPAFTQDIR